ncbi:DoxX family membrane protein [Pontimicrobium sp. MEBiC06410]
MDIKLITLFVRLLTGLIFFWQGFGKVFKMGVEAIYNGGFKSFEATFLPTFILKFSAYFTSYGELIFGALLLLGLFRKQAYYGLALILLIVTFGHGLQSPIWDLQHVFVRSVFLIFLAMTFDKDTLSLDHILKKN